MGNSIVFTLRGPWCIPIQFDVSLLILAVFFGVLFMDRGLYHDHRRHSVA